MLQKRFQNVTMKMKKVLRKMKMRATQNLQQTFKEKKIIFNNTKMNNTVNTLGGAKSVQLKEHSS
jgi:hypothetical protein